MSWLQSGHAQSERHVGDGWVGEPFLSADKTVPDPPPPHPVGRVPTRPQDVSVQLGGGIPPQ
eukprot:12430388-Karenia_brevis.AAC.1